MTAIMQPQRELMAGSTGLMVDPEPKSHRIKGFLSVETMDRAHEFTPAEEFNIPSFMAKPVLLVNHKLWLDERGNPVAAGAPRMMVVAKVAPNPDAKLWSIVKAENGALIDTFPKSKGPDLYEGVKGVWIEAEVTRDDVWKMVERGELNGLSWRGLHHTAYKSVDGTIRKVLKNIDLWEASLVNVCCNGNSTFVIAKSIDGDNILEEETDPLIVHSIKLDKSRFANRSNVEEYLKGHDLKTDTIREDSGAFFSLQDKIERFNTKRLVSIKLAEGVQAVAGPVNDTIEQRWLGQLLDVRATDELVKMFTSKSEESIMANENNATQTAQDTPGTTAPNPDADKQGQQQAGSAVQTSAQPAATQAPKGEAGTQPAGQSAAGAVTPGSGPSPIESNPPQGAAAREFDESNQQNQQQSQKDAALVEQQKQVISGLAEIVSKKTADAIVIAQKPFFEGVVTGLTNMNSTLQEAVKGFTEVVKKQQGEGQQAAEQTQGTQNNEVSNTGNNTNTQEKTDTEKGVTVVDPPSHYQSMMAALSQLGAQLVDVKEQVAVVSKSVPTQTVRAEQVAQAGQQKQETQKAADQQDPNAVFDGLALWPILAKRP